MLLLLVSVRVRIIRVARKYMMISSGQFTLLKHKQLQQQQQRHQYYSPNQIIIDFLMPLTLLASSVGNYVPNYQPPSMVVVVVVISNNAYKAEEPNLPQQRKNIQYNVGDNTNKMMAANIQREPLGLVADGYIMKRPSHTHTHNSNPEYAFIETCPYNRHTYF